jgi:hypothetical protein
MFTWHHRGADYGAPPDSLQVHRYEVAFLHQHIDGTWLATLGSHLPSEARRTRRCSSFEAGRAGCEAWAARHAAQLVAWAEAEHARWAAGQTWRPAQPAASSSTTGSNSPASSSRGALTLRDTG